ncbi:membrane protein insertase YidC [Maritimibacter fusiformis]|uniref:Membrane protein insertase YidC n=1 Tax=Maritimibacter fusiformis TaxID=2603819 RepID=A0A5D0RGF8_9RHOB|nr:membrane protein insertase YidC [Maritimibacter fusiformis]TYB80700.1 membrane protein insertase YidC [Maritimibacter fusiformis]
MENQNKNLLLATVLSFLVITGWMILFPPAEPEVAPQATAPGATAPGDATTPSTAPTVAGELAAAPVNDRAAALAETVRIPIETPDLAGSVSLIGGRIDDLHLKAYRETIDPKSDTVTLLTPAGTDHAYYALYGWAPGGALEAADVPGAATEWELVEGETLTPDSPITLAWTNDRGMTFRRTIAVDDKFMFSVTQSVENGSDEIQRLAPYGIIARHGEPDDLMGFFILHEGVIRQADNELAEIDYDDAADLAIDPREAAHAEAVPVSQNGWIGFTDHYWMTTLIPAPGQPFTSVVKWVQGADIYQTEVRLPTVELAPGASSETTTMLFAGAKEWDTIRDYEKDLGIYRFIDSIDWGMFFFLTKPMFAVLHWLHGFIGNMGWAIIGLTVIIKMILFPLARKSYISMARMRELQPEMEKIKENAGDDRTKQQQAIMELYKREKVNPASGCLPLLLQIPIFFSLYKVIFVTLELRHQPWIGWIQDLSAPDPSSILNLFGLLPYAAPGPESWFYFFSLGAMPILLGISMWMQQKLNPAPTDQTQATIMAWMPWVFMFMLGRFASGLVLYWISNNLLTFIQQYSIMRLHGHKPNVFGNIIKSFKRKPKEKDAK